MRMILIGVGLLILVLAISFATIYFLKPDLLHKLTGKNIAAADSAYALTDSTAQSAMVSISASEIDSLRQKNAWYERQLLRRMKEADSLKQVITLNSPGLSDPQKMESENAAKEKLQRESNAKDLAKTFSSMNVKEIGPILSNLDDETIIQLYVNMNSRTRKNIFLGLPKNRAAEITKQLMAYSDK